MIPQIHGELLIVGAAVGLLLAGLILSPPGGVGGPYESCHLTRHVALRCLPGAGVLPYTIAQLLGSVLGVLAARAVWGQVVAEPPVLYAVLQPGARWSTGELFAAEALSMGVIVFLVGSVRGAPHGAACALGRRGPDRNGDRATRHVHRRQRKPSPPVRTGSDVRTVALPVGLSPRTDAGSVLAAWLRQTIQHRRDVLTHRLCGTHADGSRLSNVPSSHGAQYSRNTGVVENDLGRP